METLPPSASLPRWNLSDLFTGPDDPRMFARLTALKEEAERFSGRYKGRIAELTPAELAEAMVEYERMDQDLTRTASYSRLRFAADTAPENGALLQKVRELATAASVPLLFFDVELRALPPETLEARIAAPELAGYRHFLETVRAFAPYRLTEPEERIRAEFADTGRRAFVRLHDEISAALRFSVAGREKPLTLSETIHLMSDADRPTRKAASDALTDGLSEQGRTYAFIFNTLVQDKATEDRLRGYAYPEQARHLDNELTEEIVEAVTTVAESGYPLVARYYAVKKRLLGVETLYQYDRYAPLLTEERTIAFEEARELISDAFGRFHPAYRDAARAFFDNAWIDAPVLPGKQGGAFCSYITPDHHPVIFLNYLGRPGDVRTLAHELGHGIHAYLSRERTFINFQGTLPMAEVASTFAEQLVFDRMLEGASEEGRRAAYAEQIEQQFATTFRQTMLYRFEQSVHRERRSGELSLARLNQLWQEGSHRMFGDSVTFEEGHGNWWMYISHFIATPFYVYAYTFGLMLALALYRKYREDGDAFAPKYLEMLRAGGSLSPTALVAPLGIDLADRTFWEGALKIMEEQVTAFERLNA
ncbi:MAG: M3 family oligoendopeptidase [Capsulimonadales bacterium]|nr:M3 family oligoendopeptidase [Capsulimonadales bacterium]